MRFYRNKRGGSGTVELAPALLVIFVAVLIPMLDLLYLGLAYAAGWYCNHLVVREVAVRDPAVALTAETDATKAWVNTGLANFIGVHSDAVVINTAPVWDTSPGNPAGSKDLVTVTTTVPVQPFLKIPFFANVAGLNQPINFTYSAQRPQEEKGIN